METKNILAITKCIECHEWTPANSMGFGVYCDELQKTLSEYDEDMLIPDKCPKLNETFDVREALVALRDWYHNGNEYHKDNFSKKFHVSADLIIESLDNILTKLGE